MPTRILIADDHALVREGISALLKPHEDVEIVGEAADGKEAVDKALKLRPDIVLMDVAMPVYGGLEATIEIRKTAPSIKILVLSQYDDKEYVSRLIKAGVSGYILKHAAGTDLISAIRAVMRGQFYLYAGVASGVIDGYLDKESAAEDPYERLTDREKQILKLIAEGRSHKQIAAILGISAKTVIAHQSNISEKLGIHTKAELIKFSIRRKIITIDQ